METIEIRIKADEVYSLLNNYISQGIIPLLDQVFPERNGKADHVKAADMMELRQSLHSLKMACETGIEHLTEVIDTYEES